VTSPATCCRRLELVGVDSPDRIESRSMKGSRPCTKAHDLDLNRRELRFEHRLEPRRIGRAPALRPGENGRAGADHGNGELFLFLHGLGDGADVILMNMQYSPRTDIMVSLGPYADDMRVVAQQHEIPLFDRLAIMRHWSDTGAFDLYAAGKDNVLAQRVHDCIGRGIAVMIIDAAHLRSDESKTAQ